MVGVDPQVLFWKRTSPVLFDIAGAAQKIQSPAVNLDDSLKGMAQADDPVVTLHKGKDGKWPHRRISRRCKFPEPDRPLDFHFVVSEFQVNPFGAENIVPNFAETVLLWKNTPAHGKIKAAGAGVCDRLHKGRLTSILVGTGAGNQS